MDLSKLDGFLRVFAAAFALFAAAAGLGAYFTGKRVQAGLHGQIHQLEREQQGRALTVDQLHFLSARLKALVPTAKSIYIEGLQGDREAIQLANTLKRAFEMASFEVDGVREDLRIGGTGPGIQIWQTSQQGRAGIAIKDLLAAVGLESRVVEVASLNDQKLQIIVGYKP